jgi:hypothetical protein
MKTIISALKYLIEAGALWAVFMACLGWLWAFAVISTI